MIGQGKIIQKDKEEYVNDSKAYLKSPDIKRITKNNNLNGQQEKMNILSLNSANEDAEPKEYYSPKKPLKKPSKLSP